jgi:Toastrack DUF4097
MSRLAKITMMGAAAAALLAGCAGGTVSAATRPLGAEASPPTVAAAPEAPAGTDQGSGTRTPTETTTQTFEGGVAALTVSDDAGSVSVTGGPGDKVVVVKKIFVGTARPQEQVVRAGSDLRITAPACQTDDWRKPCRIDYEIQAPSGSAVTLNTASGDLALKGLRGALTAVAASGSVHVSDAAGAVTARSVSGSVAADGTSGPLRVESTSGQVTVNAAAVAQSLVAMSVSGNATVTLPAGRYRVEADTATGQRDVAVAGDPAADTLVQVTTVTGNVRVAAR